MTRLFVFVTVKGLVGMETLESNQFVVECTHCLHLCTTDVGEEVMVPVRDTKNDKSYRLLCEVARREGRKVHEPKRLRDMDRNAQNVIPEMDDTLFKRFKGLVEDMNDPGAGHQETCPRQVRNL